MLEDTKLVEGFIEAYSYTTNLSTIKSEMFTKQHGAEFAVNEHIEIPPCSEYTLNAYVKMIQDYSVDYILHALVRGTKGKRAMTTTELRDELTGMEYVEDYNAITIIATGNGSILAKFGSVVDGEGYSIAGCDSK